MLKDLQERMLAVVSARHGTDDGLHGMEAQVHGDARLDAAGRLGVYATMYRARLRDALAGVYPALLWVLGDDAFTELAADFLDAHPSRQPSLRELGRPLPDYLAGWQAELAALEWARHDVFDAVDEDVLTMEAVAALGPQGVAALPLRLIAAHRRVPVTHNVETVWKQHSVDGEFEAPVETPGVLNPGGSASPTGNTSGSSSTMVTTTATPLPS